MAKARFCYVHLVPTATITASSEVANRPASFLKSLARWKKWRSSTSTGDQSVVFDFVVTRTIRAIVLVDWKAHGGGTIKAETWNGSSYVLFANFTLPTFNPTRAIAVWNTTGVSTSRVRIYFTNAGPSNDYVELGAVFAGDYYQPTYNLIDGFQVEPVDPSEERASVDGQVETQQRTKYHVIRGTFETEPADQFIEFRRVFETIGRHTPFVLAVNPDDPDEIFYAKLQQLPAKHDFGQYWTLQLAAREER